MTETPLEFLLRRDRAIVGAALAAVAAFAWAYTLWLANGMGAHAMAESRTAGMNIGAMLAPAFKPWSGADFVAMFVMWTVMMVGMMTPSAAPMILLYARVGREAARQGKPLAATGTFAAGYLLAWTSFSLLATIAQWALSRTALLTPMMAAADGVTGGLVLILAGLFQWTRIKHACLAHCQAPFSFVQHHGGFRRDPLGSLCLGFRHGLYCVGCCWALMALLFVGGVMNILWIAAITAFVLAEKLILLGTVIPRVAGLGLAGSGTWLLASTLLG